MPTYVHVRATPHAKKESIVLGSSNKWNVCVRQKPEGGAANERIRELVAEQLKVRPRDLRLIQGATSRSKVFLLVNHTHTV